jgi:hypothetical protein
MRPESIVTFIVHAFTFPIIALMGGVWSYIFFSAALEILRSILRNGWLLTRDQILRLIGCLIGCLITLLMGTLCVLLIFHSFDWAIAWAVIGEPRESGCYDPDLFFQRKWVQISCGSF